MLALRSSSTTLARYLKLKRARHRKSGSAAGALRIGPRGGRNLRELALLCEGLDGFDGEPIAHFYRTFVAAEVRRHVVLAQSCPHSGSKRGGLRLPTEEFQHHRRSKDGAQWVGDSLSCDIGGGAVYRLEKRRLCLVNGSGWRQPQPA